MAKKLLTKDTQLSWIRNTSGGVDQSLVNKIAKKADKSADKSTTTKKKSLRTEPATKAKKTDKKPEVRKAVKPRTATSKVVSAPKRPGAAKTSLVARPPIKPIARTTKERRKPKPAPKHEALHDSHAHTSLPYQTYEEIPAPVVEPSPQTGEASMPAEEIRALMEEIPASTDETATPTEEPLAPMDEIPYSMDEILLSTEEAPAEKKILGKILYLFSIAALICAAIFLPERYSMFVFLGFIFIALMEVSYRVGEQYHLLKSISASRNNWPALLSRR